MTLHSPPCASASRPLASPAMPCISSGGGGPNSCISSMRTITASVGVAPSPSYRAMMRVMYSCWRRYFSICSAGRRAVLEASQSGYFWLSSTNDGYNTSLDIRLSMTVSMSPLLSSPSRPSSPPAPPMDFIISAIICSIAFAMSASLGAAPSAEAFALSCSCSKRLFVEASAAALAGCAGSAAAAAAPAPSARSSSLKMSARLFSLAPLAACARPSCSSAARACCSSSLISGASAAAGGAGSFGLYLPKSSRALSRRSSSWSSAIDEADYLLLTEGVSGVHWPPERVKSGAHVQSLAQYKEMYDESIRDPEGFWTKIAGNFYWKKSWDEFHYENYDKSKGKVEIRWFSGALTNICYNALDRHVEAGHSDRIAFYWEGNEPSQASTITYGQLLARVERFANVLKAKGVQKGDTVAIYLPMVVELVVAMLAVARIGAVHSIIFGGFSAEAVADRVMDCKSRVFVTADGVYRGTKLVNLKDITNEAIDKCQARGFTVEHCIVVNNNVGCKLLPRDAWFHELEEAAAPSCPVEWVDAEHPLFMLYTSGSTGKPKGVLHTTGGYMVWASTTFKYTFDYRPEDIYFCTADIGWITGHSYITYGPLCNCATSVLFEGIPTHPDAGRFWQVIEKYKVTQFYTAPTAIRALQRLGNAYPDKYNLSTLRILGTVGEPINPEAWLWYNSAIGHEHCAVVDTWWQTETGGHMLTPLPGATPTKPGSATLPFFGIVPVVLDINGKEQQGPCSGYLAIKRSWPGQMRTVFGDHERFEQTYFGLYHGYYATGDGCRRDEHGYYWITGRVDDVINVSGHRIGTAELESALARHSAVAEAAVVGCPHDIKGFGIYAYVILKAGLVMNESLEKSLKEQVRKEIGPFAQPDVIHNAAGLPKTRSGKIMRRILRKIAAHEDDSIGDVSTLADPSVVEVLKESRPQSGAARQ
eukprot:m.128109 g.128109  ORF g.128109 m.128109 type:complete len:931 (+) comp9406_c0_seq1:194-2986(+)